MSQNRLYRHYNEQIESFRQHFKSTIEWSEVEDIHQLRVATKKIRALLTLMEIASCGRFRKKKHLKLLSKLFTNAGVLREIQVNRSILDEIELHDGSIDELCQSAIALYREELTKQGEWAIRRLIRELASFNWRKLNKLNRRLKKSINGLSTAKIIEESNLFITSQIETIHKLRSRPDNDRELHKIRARLKSMAEIYRLNNTMVPDEMLQKKIGRLKRLENRIGKWHDYTVLISSIEQFIKNGQGIRIIEPIKRVVEDIRGQNGMLRGEVIDRLEEIFAN
ncbi:MAG: CHAD domain-containing protein [Gammaproteobacteria bacterium]|nr:CHAD domain-containing protein [Gammaproteobacteria bacterium]